MNNKKSLNKNIAIEIAKWLLYDRQCFKNFTTSYKFNIHKSITVLNISSRKETIYSSSNDNKIYRSKSYKV